MISKEDLLKEKAEIEKENETAWQYYSSWQILALNKTRLQRIEELLNEYQLHGSD